MTDKLARMERQHFNRKLREWEAATETRKCEHCIHYRRKHVLTPDSINWQLRAFCALERPLEPCDDYEREPGADDA